METLLSTKRPGEDENDPLLLRVALFLAEPPDYFKFSMNVIFHRTNEGEVHGCIIAATLLINEQKILNDYKCTIDQLPICGISFPEVAQALLGLEDEDFDELCYPEDVELADITNASAAEACHDLYHQGYVNWKVILDD